jgi:KDO2-lipid IV(A) lauroyltransferase
LAGLSRLMAGLLVALIRAVPDGPRRGMARGVGSLAYLLGIRRRVALENLRAAFPERTESELRRIARGAYRNLALGALEALTVNQLSDAALAQAVVTDDWAPIEAAYQAGRGLLVASAHFGSWELFAEVMSRRGHKLSAVVRPLRGAFNERLVESRRASGIGLIAPRGAIRESVKALRQGSAVAMLIDQAIAAKASAAVPFFGRLASTTLALSAAARRSGAPAFVVMAAREGGRLRMFVEGPFPVPDTGDPRADLIAHTARLTSVIESYVRRYPEQWLWLHRRWKATPQMAMRSPTPTSKSVGRMSSGGIGTPL